MKFKFKDEEKNISVEIINNISWTDALEEFYRFLGMIGYKITEEDFKENFKDIFEDTL